jgi:glycerol-3-phosphate acyltransferase PlsX
MSDLVKIAVDAMGGDNSPRKIIDGIIHHHNSNKDNFYMIFGNETEIKKCINNQLDQKFLLKV